MITEQEKENQKVKQIRNGIRICEEAIAKAEKYERLKDNKDFIDYLKDLKILADLHDREIKMGESMLIDAPNSGYVKTAFEKQEYVSSRQDWIDFIIRHQIQKAECTKWVKEPDQIIAFASLCREKLPLLQQQLSEIEGDADEEDRTRGNGKS